LYTKCTTIIILHLNFHSIVLNTFSQIYSTPIFLSLLFIEEGQKNCSPFSSREPLLEKFYCFPHIFLPNYIRNEKFPGISNYKKSLSVFQMKFWRDKKIVRSLSVQAEKIFVVSLIREKINFSVDLFYLCMCFSFFFLIKIEVFPFLLRLCFSFLIKICLVFLFSC
jgi:hypothetical protein